MLYSLAITPYWLMLKISNFVWMLRGLIIYVV